MKDLSLTSALRYMFPGIVAFFYVYICNPSFVQKTIKSLETLLAVMVIISFIFLGSILYLLYRPIYNFVVLPFHDFCRRKSDNYRTYLKKHYSNYKIGTYEAMQLWIQIRDKYFPDRYSQAMKETASGIHLVYLAGITALPFAFWMLAIGNFTLLWLFLSIALICFLGAFFLDRSYEDIELRFLYSLDDAQRHDLDLFVSRILQNRFPTSN